MRKDNPCDRECFGCKYLKLGHICTKGGTCPREVRDTVITVVAIVLIIIFGKLLEMYM